MLLAAALSLPGTLLSQTENFKPRPIPNRFLIVVETSRAMDKREGAIGQVLNQLVLSGMNGQLRNGDSLGLWTFNDDLHGGEFPLQEWSEGNQTNVAGLVAAFIQKQKFGKAGHITKVLPEMGRLARVSDAITFILISSGSETMTGTPFDTKINESYTKWKEQQAKAHQPFVTVLRANKGRLTDFRVTPAPWPVELPALPVPPPVAPPIASVPKAQPRVLPPLIVSGRKTNAVETSSVAPTPSAPATAASPPASKPVGAVEHTNLISKIDQTNASPVLAATPTSAQTIAAAENSSPSNTSPAVKSPSAGATDPDALPVFARNLVPDGPDPKAEPAPASTVVAVQAPRSSLVSSDKRLWLFGAAGCGTVAGIFLIFLARSRQKAQPSFITHSINRRGGSL